MKTRHGQDNYKDNGSPLDLNEFSTRFALDKDHLHSASRMSKISSSFDESDCQNQSELSPTHSSRSSCDSCDTCSCDSMSSSAKLEYSHGDLKMYSGQHITHQQSTGSCLVPNYESSKSSFANRSNASRSSISDPLLDEWINFDLRKNTDLNHPLSEHDFNRYLSQALSSSAQQKKQRVVEKIKSQKFIKKGQQRYRDLIIPDEDNEEFPFSKKVFSRKKRRGGTDTSSTSSMDSAHLSIDSYGLFEQYSKLKGIKPHISRVDSSFASSIVSSGTASDHFVTSNSVSSNTSNDRINHDFDNFQQSVSNSSVMQKDGTFFSKGDVVSGGYPSRSPLPTMRHSGITFHRQHPSVPLDTMSYHPLIAEQVLMNLGFADGSEFLPERFMRSWYEKIVKNSTNLHSFMPHQGQTSYPEHYESFDQSYFHNRGSDNSKINARKESFDQLNDNALLSTCMASRPFQYPKRFFKSGSRPRTNSFNDKLLQHRPLCRTTVSDRLITNTASEDANCKSKTRETCVDMRRQMYSRNRQNSLPLFLETLSEEDDIKVRSRSPSFDGQDNRDSHMKKFFIHEGKNSQEYNDSDGDSQNNISLHVFHNSTCDENFSNSASPQHVISDVELFIQKHTDTSNSSKPKALRSVPSIVVSEKLASAGDICSPVDNKTLCIIERPKTPVPHKEKEQIISTDSLEVAEIMSGRQWGHRVENIFKCTDVLPEEHDGNSGEGPHSFMYGREERRLSTSSKFLTVSDRDDKLLSPTPSSSSPCSYLSPVTVIEIKNLDNQNNSLDYEISQDRNKIPSESLSSLSDVSQMENACQADVTYPDINFSRKSYHRETDNSSDISTSTMDTQQGGPIEKRVVGTQAEDGTLMPLVSLSDLSGLAKNFLQASSNGFANIFCLVQDKGTQWDNVDYDQDDLDAGNKKLEKQNISDKLNGCHSNSANILMDGSINSEDLSRQRNRLISVNCCHKFSSSKQKQCTRLNYNNCNIFEEDSNDLLQNENCGIIVCKADGNINSERLGYHDNHLDHKVENDNFDQERKSGLEDNDSGKGYLFRSEVFILVDDSGRPSFRSSAFIPFGTDRKKDSDSVEKQQHCSHSNGSFEGHDENISSKNENDNDAFKMRFSKFVKNEEHFERLCTCSEAKFKPWGMSDTEKCKNSCQRICLGRGLSDKMGSSKMNGSVDYESHSFTEVSPKCLISGRDVYKSNEPSLFQHLMPPEEHKLCSNIKSVDFHNGTECFLPEKVTDKDTIHCEENKFHDVDKDDKTFETKDFKKQYYIDQSELFQQESRSCFDDEDHDFTFSHKISAKETFNRILLSRKISSQLQFFLKEDGIVQSDYVPD